ncbi:hypothetical protein [Salinarimonas ramus]|uniref:Uncharacterized protein n=1 Tax=Salinarimonas ramus TaxID=690164 RepID=A0A917QDZ5_9HYPH|nr:hypothetical protein [Salinarimonas ramus]GGK45296.1 hypothetical protein GCM10011322_35620 [Salinarimonas ramus]
MSAFEGMYTQADLSAARRRARLAREKAQRYRGTSAQMRRKLEARAAMAETEANLIAYALGEDDPPARPRSHELAAASPPSL